MNALDKKKYTDTLKDKRPSSAKQVGWCNEVPKNQYGSSKRY
jgi:hypothetical protein